MGPIAETLGAQVAAGLVAEAFDEIKGRSTKKWALVILAAVAGVAITLFVVRRRREREADVIDEAATLP